MSRTGERLIVAGCACLAALVVWLAFRESPAPMRTVEHPVAPEPEAERVAPEPDPPPEPEPEPVIRPEPLGAARILVVDASELALPGVRVGLARCGPTGLEERVGGSTDAEGYVEWRDLVPGKYQLSVVAGSIRKYLYPELAADRTEWIKVVLPREGSLLKGVVRHAEKGPLAGSTVTLRFERLHLSGKSDEEGNYRIDNIPPGAYWITLDGRVVPGELLVGRDEILRRDLEVGVVSVEGVVRDAISRAPVPGVMVRAQKPASREYYTDSQGRYRLCDLPAGRRKLVLAREGYEFLFVEFDDGTESYDVLLHPSAVLHLTVTDEAGFPVVGRMRLEMATRESTVTTGVKTDPEGRGIYRKVRPGRFRLSVRMGEARSPAQEYEVGAGENHVHFRLPIAEATGPESLGGTVTDMLTRQPIAGAQIHVKTRPRRFVFTDRTGRYALKGLPAGTYKVWVSRDGYGPRYFPEVRVRDGSERRLDVALPRAATLRLTLIDSRGERYRGRVLLSFRDPDTRKATGSFVDPDVAGELVYRQILPGSYELSVDAQQHGTAKVPVVIRTGENEIEVRLKAD